MGVLVNIEESKEQGTTFPLLARWEEQGLIVFLNKTIMVRFWLLVVLIIMLVNTELLSVISPIGKSYQKVIK